MVKDLFVTIELDQESLGKFERTLISLVLKYRQLCRYSSRSPKYDAYKRYLKEQYGKD